MQPPGTQLLSVVIPAHNEAAGIAHAVDVIRGVLESCAPDWEIIVVDDGSRDATFARIQDLARQDARVKGLRFSRNFGKEAALLAGLRAARGDAVVTIDADLQHPPHLIPAMLDAWEKGARVVDAVKRRREADGLITRARARVFNTLLSSLAGIDLQDSSDFKLLDRAVVDTITRQLPERHRFYRGLSAWVGYEREQILFDVEARARGEGKWTVRPLLSLAATAVISFTSAPLRIVTVMGLITLAFGLAVATEAFVGWLQGRAVSGFITTLFVQLFLGSFIMISLGIIGEYIAKIYDEIKARPPYLIDARAGLEEDAAGKARPREGR